MNEAQRFLRYVTPGLVFLAETLILLLILFPDWTVAQVNAVKGNEALGVIFATLLMSGGIGFIFSVVHHVIHWTRFDARMLDHSGLIARLRAREVIQLVDARTNIPISDNVVVTRVDAWVIATSLSNERLTTSEQIKGADLQVGVLVNMMHTTGTTRTATVVAWLVAFAIAAHVGHFSSEFAPVVRFIVANIVAGLLLFVQHENYKRVSQLAQGLVEEVLHDALLMEKEKPIRTNVMLTG